MLLFSTLAAVLTIVEGVPHSYSSSPDSRNSTLPDVDLGYDLHQAAKVNSTGPVPYYEFTNVRFGQAPVGRHRFDAPRAPVARAEKNVTNGTSLGAVKCPNVNPNWELPAFAFLADYLSGRNYSQYTKTNASILATQSPANKTTPTPSEGETEDCLFLDVFVPTQVFHSTKNETTSHEGSKGAAILVWIYGGGYTSGSKTSSGVPATLIAHSTVNGTTEPMIFVQLNYRLGIFGWLSGDDDVTANAGLLDQRLALEWIHKHIHKFGGDPERITVMGESAGGGSIMHHIASPSYYPALFHQAIPQSPAYEPFLVSQTTAIFKGILTAASLYTGKNITSASDLRALSWEALYALNNYLISSSSYGTFTFGPVVDGSYVPDLPLKRIAAGEFQKKTTIFVGHNSDEGLLFTPPSVQTDEEMLASTLQLFPTMNTSTLDYVLNTLYPEDYAGTQPYTSPIQRTATFISDFLVGCNAHILAGTPGGFAFLYNIIPGLHGSDVAYTFWNGDTSTENEGAFPVQATVATQYQTALGAFVNGGGAALKELGIANYGKNNTINQLTLQSFGEVTSVDPAFRPLHCNFWVSSPYDS